VGATHRRPSRGASNRALDLDWRRNRDSSSYALYPIVSYSVWQRVDGPLTIALEGAEATAVEIPLPDSWDLAVSGGRTFLLGAAGMPAGTWELVGNFNAIQQEQYLYRVSTVVDSSGAGTPWSVYLVTTHTPTPAVWWVSEPDSGYSVDNLAPAGPEGLAGEQSFDPAGLLISWNENGENDLYGYEVYRGTSADFVPALENRIGTPPGPFFVDEEWRWDSEYWYKVAAVDVHGNESGYSVLDPSFITGDETPAVPSASYLAQNTPNPFNPSTTIRFGLSRSCPVRIRIYDVAGRLVHTLIEETLRAGHHELAWNGRDDSGRALSSGIFFCRLEAEDFIESRKMILLR